jgi:hypothetical protein
MEEVDGQQKLNTADDFEYGEYDEQKQFGHPATLCTRTNP